jgi:hypothetical protein
MTDWKDKFEDISKEKIININLMELFTSTRDMLEKNLVEELGEEVYDEAKVILSSISSLKLQPSYQISQIDITRILSFFKRLSPGSIIYQKFLKASASQQFTILWFSKTIKRESLISYFSIIFDSNLTTDILVPRGVSKSDLYSLALDSSNSLKDVSENFAKAVTEFANLVETKDSDEKMMAVFAEVDFCFTSSSLYVLRTMYGEQRVLEIIRRVNDEKTKCSVLDVSKLLENWDDYRELPLTWAMSLTSV